MISNKKSYAMKMLQLALALSLLHVDPDNYLQELQLRNWDSQLELRHGDGWELEMLRAVPMVEYPYANRKTMMPLIEDLVRFDREHAAHQYNVTAYLLNVQNDSANQTAALQELQATTSVGATGVSTASSANAGAIALEHVTTVVNSPNNSAVSPDLELFLNSEQFNDQRSVWEQNLADLNDFNDLPGMPQYNNILLKDVNMDNNFVDVHLEQFLINFRGENSANEQYPASAYGLVAADPDILQGALALNYTFPTPSASSIVKVEPLDGDEIDVKENMSLFDEAASCSSASSSSAADCIKKEQEDSTEEAKYEVDLSPFINPVELTKEESEIVEVLWKQDVDLGYSLNPAQLGQTAEQQSTSNAAAVLKKLQSDNSINDDIEKLKALEELKIDKPENDHDENNVDIGDEWAGIPFTIDNETGEYIRLPLDDLINDVLQFAELAGVNNELDDDSIASTSKAAAAAATHNNNNIKTDNDDDSLNNNNSNNNNLEESLKNNNLLDDDELPQSEIEVSSLPSPLFDLDDEAKKELADFDKMIQSAPFHHPHPHAHAHTHHHHAAAAAAAHHHHAAAHHHHAAAAAAVQRGLSGASSSMQTANYPTVGGGVNSAFQRQTSTGFHHGHHQGRMPLSRGVSMEQRLQDIASLFNPLPSMGVVGGVSDMPPYPHYPTHHYGYQATAPQHAQYPHAPPPHPHSHHGMLHPNSTLGDICSTQPHYGHNLGSAVSSSMHLTNASHEADAATGGAYKMEHEMMYYSNASSDLNHTSDGFINSILNDDDLHLMDMNVNDSFCRMVDVNNSTSNNSSVLGISTSGHGSTAGSNAGTVSMNGASANAAGNNAVMTTDLMGATAQGGTDRLDASSDSAVSSMGSERVPSLSDGEWGEGSDSAQDYHQSKYGGPYDYSYNNATGTRLNDGTRQPPVAQKKHQMFGKRYLNEQSPLAGTTAENNTLDGATGATMQQGPAPHNIKYECEQYPNIPGLPAQNGFDDASAGAAGAMGPAMLKDHHHGYDLKYAGANGMGPSAIGGYSLDFSVRPPRNSHEIVQHNHTYTLPQGTGSIPRPQQRDKKLSTSSSRSSKSGGSSAGSSMEEHMTRDEKRARALNIPIPVTDIINLPMDEFNERLSKYDLNENQLSLIRDIRRRGKNKVAAQNCRKRKLDQILSLEDEVKEVVRRKQQLQAERDSLTTERKRVVAKFSALHRHIFQYLRDPDGNPCSPADYSLQQAADGSIFLLPRDSSNKTDNSNGVAVDTGAGAGNLNHHAMHQTQQQQQAQQHHQSMLAHTQNHHASLVQPQQQHSQQQQQQSSQSQQQQHHHHLHAQHQHQHHPTQQKD